MGQLHVYSKHAKDMQHLWSYNQMVLYELDCYYN